MTEDRKKATAANRRAWNAAAEHHKAHAQYKRLLEGFAEPGFSCLDEIETALWRQLGVEGKNVAQLCCNNGREILSVKNLGAELCVGFDQAGGFLAQGRELAGVAGLDCDFVEADVLALPARWDARFDVVFVTIGVFGWLPDLRGFVDTAARLLKPGGAFFAYEEHPIMNVFEPERDDPMRPVNSYFKAKPFAEAVSLDYYGNADYDAPLHYWYVHKMSDIIMACLEAGLAIEHLREYPHNVNAAVFDVYEKQDAQLPLSFTLIARKAG